MAFVLLLVLTVGTIVPTAYGSITNGDRQAYDVRSLKIAVEHVFRETGQYPITDSSSTWFEKIVRDGAINPGNLDCGTTADGTLPLDLYGRPLVYEILDPAIAGTAVIRSVGKNGIDDQGRGDDFDSRYGANLGYWNKSNWPEFFAFTGGGWLLALGIAILVWFKTHHIWRSFRVFLFAGGLLVGVLTHFFFDCGVARTSACRLPNWGHDLVLYSLLGLLPGVGVAIVGGVRASRRSKRHESGLCIECKYDLQGSSSQRCPECGTAVRR